MRKTLSLALAAAIAAGSVLSAGAASAQYYRGGHDHGRHRGDSGAAIAAGIAGLAIGAALASNHPHSYGRPYYRESYYAGPYYAPGYYAPGYYDYGPGYADCRTERAWDPYIGRWITRTHCW